jgi:hypothetical protein
MRGGLVPTMIGSQPWHRPLAAVRTHRKDTPWNMHCLPCPSRWMHWRRI